MQCRALCSESMGIGSSVVNVFLKGCGYGCSEFLSVTLEHVIIRLCIAQNNCIPQARHISYIHTILYNSLRDATWY